MPKGIYKRKSAAEVDKNSIQCLKYKDMAIEFIKQGYNNIRGIYHKYYPNASDESIDTVAYQLLDNLRFQAMLEEAWQEIKREDLNIAQTVIQTLYNIAIKGKKEADRINAASWLGKCEAMFTDKVKNEGGLITQIVIKLPSEDIDANRISIDSEAGKSVSLINKQ